MPNLNPVNLIGRMKPPPSPNFVRFKSDSIPRWLVGERAQVKPTNDFSFDEFCTRLQVHGLLDWYRARSKLSALFWLAMMAVFMCITVLTVYNCVHTWYNQPILTTVSIETAQAYQFPSIQICPCTYINTSAPNATEAQAQLSSLFASNRSDAVNSILPGLENDWRYLSNAVPTLGVPGDARPFSTSFLKPVINNLTDAHALVMSAVFSTDQFLRECRIKEETFKCSDKARALLDPIHGVCWQLNLTKTLQNKPGIGLRVLVDIHPEIRGESLLDGVTVKINKLDSPIASEQVLLAPGQFVQVDLSMTEQALLNWERGRTPQYCTDKSKNYDYQMFQAGYTKALCEQDCLHTVIYDNCNCVMRVDPSHLKPVYRAAMFCNQTNKECVEQVTQRSQNDASIRTCVSKCHVPCRETVYHMKTSSLKFPSQSMRNSLLYLPQRPAEESLLILDIAFTKMEYVQYMQSPSTTINQMISDIGGNAGLWLGASMVTFVQALALAINWCYSRRRGGGDGNVDVVVFENENAKRAEDVTGTAGVVLGSKT